MISALHPRFNTTPPRMQPRRPEPAGEAPDSATLRAAMGAYPTGVAVATTVHEGQPIGMTVGTLTSISLRPPLVGFFADRSSRSLPRIIEAGHFAANVLDEDGRDLCGQFSRPAADRFEGVEWRTSELGSPVLGAASLWVDCALDEVIPVGDHFLVVGRVASLHRNPRSAAPLVFHGGTFNSVRRLDGSASSQERQAQ